MIINTHVEAVFRWLLTMSTHFGVSLSSTLQFHKSLLSNQALVQKTIDLTH
jgi:hypothetical protein